MSVDPESYVQVPELQSARTAQNPRELGREYLSALRGAEFAIKGDYGLENLLNSDTGIAVATGRDYDDSFDRPEVDPRLTFRLQDFEQTPNESSAAQYPAPEGLPNYMIAGSLRIPVEDPIPSDVASGKTNVASKLSEDDPYFEPGELDRDLQFAFTDANPPGTIQTSLNNIRETAEALAYIQDQNIPPQMAFASFEDRIDSNTAPDVVEPVIFTSDDGFSENEYIGENIGSPFQAREPFAGSAENTMEMTKREDGPRDLLEINREADMKILEEEKILE